MDAIEVKRSLFNKFKDSFDFRGAGIREKDGKEYVVVKLLNSNASIRNQIPSKMNGIDIFIEFSGNISAY